MNLSSSDVALTRDEAQIIVAHAMESKKVPARLTEALALLQIDKETFHRCKAELAEKMVVYTKGEIPVSPFDPLFTGTDMYQHPSCPDEATSLFV